MRTLSSTSRILSAAAILVAALLVLGGAYFVGYISQLQRDLSDPSLREQAVAQIATVEKALGYDGFLKTYRNFRLTGDSAARPLLARQTAAAAAAIENLRTLYAQDPAAPDALREARAIGETFAFVARSAPDTGAVALRGTASMDALNTLPQTPQLEAAYMSLRNALDRLKQAEQAHQLGDVAFVLSWSQTLLLAALASLVLGLLVVAGLLHLGIIHPLKSLERSLASLGDGNVTQQVWGAERKDEFGEIARAGEKLRRGLTEAGALRELAEKGQLHVSLEGQGSFLLEELASQVTSAADALKSASADLARVQVKDREELDAALTKLNQTSAGVDEAAKTLRRDSEAAVQDIRASAADLLGAAKKRTDRLDDIAGRFETGSQQLESLITSVKSSSSHVVEELATATGSIKRVVDDAQQIQNAFFSTCDKISGDAANTTENVRTLAAGLSDAVGAVDQRLSDKLSALDNLERGLSGALSKLQTSTDDTIAALGRAASVIDERGAVTEKRIDKTVGEFEEIVRIFRDDEVALNQTSATAIAELQSTQRAIAEAAQARQSDNRQFAEATARLEEIAQRLAAPAPASALHADALRDELRSFTQAVRQEMDAVRGEIRDMAVRMTEDRIMSTGGGPVFTVGTLASTPHPTLADIPDAELMSRLKNLADEMSAAQRRTDQTSSLKAALGAFASEVKKLAQGADRAARLKSMGKALDHHAEEIDAHADAVEPSATALRTELHAITSELRTIAARAQSSGVVKEAPRLRESAIELGERAESLFTYFETTHHAPQTEDEAPQDTIDAASADIAALASLLSRLEDRTERLSQMAVASRFEEISDTMSPSEREASAHNTELKTGGAIHTVFESIERLNNIAAALARAGDAERQRKAAH